MRQLLHQRQREVQAAAGVRVLMRLAVHILSFGLSTAGLAKVSLSDGNSFLSTCGDASSGTTPRTTCTAPT